MKDFFKLALVNLRQRVIRTLLTMIGIFIGIAAVVSLISLGQGLQNAVNQEFASLGGDKLLIQGAQAGFAPPGSATSGTVTDDDRDVIERVRGIKLTAGRIFEGVTVEFQNELRTQFAISIPDELEEAQLIIEAMNVKVANGRLLKHNEKGNIMIGYWYGEKNGVFSKAVAVGNKLIINEKPFEVIGLLKKRGDQAIDKGIFLPDPDIKEVLGGKEELNMIFAQIEPGLDPTVVGESVTRAMRKDRHQKEGREDFSVGTSEDLIDSFNRILLIVQAVIIGIACISLLVGGIGIMNTMFTSVLERTKEIGIMKAIGATNKDIQTLFLIESGLLGMAGGSIGIIIGIGLSKSVELVAVQVWGPNLLQASVSPVLLFGALAFSFGIGTLSGVMPARRAARLKPVDALRYE
ncbi:MAG: ABC transporter permease [Candidatus Woesearchaeota archaeon]|nr:ABC transporter permease [Candidatus Woesearchaeota archaeon]MDP7181166.1 ABC transporter permease [Candidatus Woesearchaeota archaeon]MDP7198213.1 ABC transporter permease [Candidatus Woesearchaeota archaeon]MDP7467049.1 ABC transporter permease [Candidatus Woesearchaeota archaeon]MDP7646717.1 ABC transporter permease [Candidatus Woesearchaeota archaeon]